jgi:hypothetical protein
MQAAAWINLIRRIPPAQHNCLVLTTAYGTEVVVQCLIRLDRDFLVCLGRLAGSTDQGKLLILPYDQITCLSFNKKMTDDEIQAVIGKPGVAVQLVETAPGSELDPEAVEQLAAEIVDFPLASAADPGDSTPLPDAEQSAADAKSTKVAPPSKSVLLARLRQRLANDVAKQTGTP